jgi:hypothetical protein
MDNETTLSGGSVYVPCEDRLGTHRTVFLTNNARAIHGPWKASPPINESSAHTDRASNRKPALSLLFFNADWSYGRRWTHLSTGDTIVLATTGTDSKIQQGRPESFQSSLEGGRMNDVRRTNSHALATFDAPF